MKHLDTCYEILVEANTGVDDVLWCERSGFGRCGFATSGFVKDFLSIQDIHLPVFPMNLRPHIHLDRVHAHPKGRR